MKKTLAVIGMIGLSGFLFACGGGGSSSTPASDTTPVVTEESTSATENVSTNTPGTTNITTESGAQISVPEGAVPETISGGNGTIAFSIEKDTTTQVTLPEGVTRSSDIYRFGPGSTIFNSPVAVTIPYSGVYSAEKEYTLYRVDPTTGIAEPYSATYNADTNSFTAQTYEFSPWFLGDRPYADTASGCVNVDNSSSSIWRSVVTQQYTMKYPSSGFNGASALWSNGSIGWSNHSDWYLPQGTYQMCVEGGDLNSRVHSASIPVTIDSPWHYDRRVCTDLNIGSVSLNQSGPCSMSPTPTPSVGTGDLQISLSWHSVAAIDLDLHVVEPGGELIYYQNTDSAAGGELDRDNKCDDYINGQSENIFWTSPPAGQYTIKIDFFDNCSSSSTTSMPFDLRVVNKGVTTTYSGTASTSNTEAVTFKTITVN
ncbi:MAG: hypothetical protein KKB30_03815 [Proteobacteria bacterium]|nr:hypothetical protein [Pseudomonadota bacterium]MBU1715644.1 hypothetical protein [Pseudomonadota bacterium]